MGGIVGKLSFDPREQLSLPTVARMLDASVDALEPGRGLYTAPGIAIGWSGRADRTPSSAATHECETLHAAADARLTNAEALRGELENLGHRFRGETDAEVILRAFEQWGARAFRRLRGPFACAIWDPMQRRLIVARDHIGIIPIYFAVLRNHGIVFASEVDALLREPGVGREWCPAGIDAYLTVGYIPAPLSPYQRISKLEAAHILVVEGRRLHVEPYWDLPVSASEGSIPDEDLITAAGRRLRRAVGEQTADGEAGVLLYSGGTASTSLLWGAADTRPAVVTVAAEQEQSELVRSEHAASLLGRRRELESFAADVPALARQLAAVCGEPLADPSAIIQFATFAVASRYGDCALAAHGATTLWAGYPRHRVERIEIAARTLLRRPLATLGAGVGAWLQDSVRGARALSHLALPPADACAVKHAYGFWDDDHRRTLYTRGFAWAVRDSNPFARHLELYASRDSADPLDRAIYVDARTFLPDSLLPAAQCAARAAGVRLRLPMLDVDFVDYAASMPIRLKQGASADLYALLALLARELPQSAMPAARRVPSRHPWLGPALRALVPSVLLGPRFDTRGIVSRPRLRALWKEHQSGRRNHAQRLWSLLMLEFWFRNAIDGNAADVPIEYAVLKAA